MLTLSRTRRGVVLAASVCALLVCATGSFAQSVLGTIQGQITDSSGAALPGVTVVVKNTGTGVERTVVTDATGRYKAAKIQPGIYEVTAALDGFQTSRRGNVDLLVGQVLDVNLGLNVGEVSEVITVTSETPLVEVSRSSTASYVSEQEIEALPIVGRDFKEFAFLAPTVQNDDVRGFVTMSGQRGIYSGLNIDGTSAKSAFFGYGRGGESTENDGLVVAQDSVKEFQVVTNGFAPEYGANAGGYINVVTKSGTNDYTASAFYQFRDEGFTEDIPSSPLDDSRGIDGSNEQAAFEVQNYGISFGGPIKRDRTHFFLTYDKAERDDPFTRSLRTPGLFDAITQRAQAEPGFAGLLDGYTRNADGSATGLFLRSVDNSILFGKLDHQFNDSNSGSFRINLTDYERTSTFKDEESLKTEETTSFVGSLVSIVGSRGVNEARVQIATDELDRLSQRVGEPIEAQIRFRFGSFDSVGKFDFLPILVEEDKLQVQDSFSYLFGEHDLKFGFDYQEDALGQLFAGSLDGRYDFRSIDDFLNNNASVARIYFGNVTFPNYDETQELFGIYAQDSWKPNGQLTLNYGIRYNATFNPDGLTHLLPEGRSIPDDTNNWAPRVGFAYSLDEDGSQILRGGIGIFYGRTPSLLFASQVQENGLFPNFGRRFVGPGDVGFVPLGSPINNENPPPDIIPSTSFVNPNFEDQETLRINFGYERQLASDWSASVDALYAEGDNLQSNIELNRTLIGLDSFGRPMWSGTRPNPAIDQIFVRESIGESEYTAITLKVNKRFSGRYMVQAHYTWSEDKDTDSNERSATNVTVTNPNDPRFDFGPSDRDVENRIVISGLVVLPFEIKLSGIFEYRSGTPYSAVDQYLERSYCPSGIGNECPDIYAVVNGQLTGRNQFRNDSVTNLDLRLSKFFKVGKYEIDLYGEVFNLFDENTFTVDFGQQQANFSATTTNAEFGIPDDLITDPREYQIGVRISFN